jgi:hypothetical protein
MRGEICLFFLQSVQTGCVAHLAPYLMGTGVSSLGLKRSGLETDHLPPTSAKVKMSGAILYILLMPL